MKDKRGFELGWNFIVIMVLSIMLLTFSIAFFTGSAGSFYDKLKGFFSYSNVDSIVQSCNFLADSNSRYNYCCEKIKVKYFFNGVKQENLFSCGDLTNQTFIKEGLKIIDCGEMVC